MPKARHASAARRLEDIPNIGPALARHLRSVGIALIGATKKALGELSRVKQVVKVLGMVNAQADFTGQPKMINACSGLFVEAFGDRDRHARSALGMGSRPCGFAVETEAIVEFE